MNNEFPDNSNFLFGREPELSYLTSRSRQRGLTAIVGRPQMGKSWLLLESARRLSTRGWPGQLAAGGELSLRGKPPLVGMVESQGESPDMLPRAVQDLYTRWLAGSSFQDQAAVVAQQQKKDLVGRVGEAVGSLFETVAGLHAKPVEVVGKLVKQTFDGLASANRELVDGTIKLPQLQIEQSKELLKIVSDITERPALLFCDQWEKSPDLKKEATILDNFLRHVEDWPACHIVLGTRADPVPSKLIAQFSADYPGLAEVYELQLMHLNDGQTEIGMLASLRARVPATRELADGDLLELIAGYPRVLAQWTSPYNAQRIVSRADLVKVAEAANAYQYLELAELVNALGDSARLAAIRLALLPASGTREGWPALKPIVQSGGAPKDLDTLLATGVLQASPPPTYGHAKRAEAALATLLSKHHEETCAGAEELVANLAALITDASARELPYANALAGIRAFAPRLELSLVALALSEGAHALLAEGHIDASKFLGIASQATLPSTLPLLAMGLNNTLLTAQNADLHGSERLLDELRELAQRFPEESAVRDQLARGLYNSINDAQRKQQPEGRERLLDELSSLTAKYPEDAAVRAMLAKALYNVLVFLKQQGALEQRDLIIASLEGLVVKHPEDAAAREQLGMAWNAALAYAHQEGQTAKRDTFLVKLQRLCHAVPEDGHVRHSLGAALANMILYTTGESPMEERQLLLSELRILSQAYPGDTVLREDLARGLFEMLDTGGMGGPEDWKVPLGELWELSAAEPAESVPREMLAKGLFNTLCQIKGTHLLQHRISLLDGLRALVAAHPGDEATRRQLAMGLFNTQNDVFHEENFTLREEFVAELRSLIEAHPEDYFLSGMANRLQAAVS